MMIKCVFSAIASRVIVDESTKQASVVDMIDEISSQSFPIVIPSITCVYSLLSNTIAASYSSISIRAVLGENEIFNSPIEVDFENTYRTRAIITFQGFIIPSDGELRFELYCDGSKLAETYTSVKKLDIKPTSMSVNLG